MKIYSYILFLKPCKQTDDIAPYKKDTNTKQSQRLSGATGHAKEQQSWQMKLKQNGVSWHKIW